MNRIDLVKDILSRISGKKCGEIKDDDRLVWELAMDSVEIIEFLLQLENEGIFLPDDTLTGEMTVMSVTQAIQNVSGSD